MRDDAWNNYCLYALDFWDANIMTTCQEVAQDGWGHAPEALKRNVEID